MGIQEGHILLDQIKSGICFVDAIQPLATTLAGWTYLPCSKPLPEAHSL